MDQLTGQATVTLVIDDPIARQCYPLVVPGSTEQEGYAFLRSLDNGVGGAGARQFLAGATWDPIRRRYQAVDRALVEAAQVKVARLGPNPSTAELEALVRQASGQRTTAARLWRVPSGPDAFLAAEARDWAKYGVGGRNFNNLMKRSQANAARATWSRDEHLRQILRNVEKTNAAVDAAVLRNARYLKAGGAILMVAGIGWTYHEYQNTPEHQKAEFIRREAVTTVGGALATGLATAVLVAVGASGAVVIGVGLVAGVVGALAAEGVYRSIYGKSLVGQLRDTGVIQAGLLQGR